MFIHNVTSSITDNSTIEEETLLSVMREIARMRSEEVASETETHSSQHDETQSSMLEEKDKRSDGSRTNSSTEKEISSDDEFKLKIECSKSTPVVKSNKNIKLDLKLLKIRQKPRTIEFGNGDSKTPSKSNDSLIFPAIMNKLEMLENENNKLRTEIRADFQEQCNITNKHISVQLKTRSWSSSTR